MLADLSSGGKFLLPVSDSFAGAEPRLVQRVRFTAYVSRQIIHLVVCTLAIKH